MKRRMLANATTILAVLGQSACSSEPPRTGAQASSTGGVASGFDAGDASFAGADAGTTKGGAMTIGTSDSSGGASVTYGGASGTQGGVSSVSSGAGPSMQGGTVATTGGAASNTGGASSSPGLPSQCSAKFKVGASQVLAGLTLDTSGEFAAITPDELTIVWTVPSTTGVTVQVADRASVAGAWAPQSITDVPALGGRVAVTPDGLVLAYVDSSTGRAFATMSRVDRNGVFQFNDPTSGFDFVIQNSSARLGAGDGYAYPIFGPHMTSFYYAIKTAAGELTWYEAGRFEAQGVFTEGAPIAFATQPSVTSILTGVASDENTLFFLDSSSGQTSWSFYDEPTTAFGAWSGLGALGFVQPSQSCSRLYGSASAGSITLSSLQ